MTDTATTVLRRAVRRIVTLTLTLMFFVGAAAGVFAGLSVLSDGADATPDVLAPPTTVGVMRVETTEGYAVTRRFTGQIEAVARTDLGFELGGRVTEVLVEEGDLVASGAVLARLDIRALVPDRAALEAELAALAADAELARLALGRNETLAERGFRSTAAQDDARLALTRAEAGMAAVRARIAGVDVAMEKSVLVAPFDARIGARLADPGQTAAVGQTVLVLFDASPARLRVGVPPDLAATLSPGDAVSVEIDGTSGIASVLQVRPDLDPSTRSRSVVLALPPGPEPVLGGTADLILEQRIAEPGFWAPLSALREGVRGSWSVMALETTPAGDRTLPAAVEVIHAEGARVFLRGGLPEGARIVAEAPDRVAPGQMVLAQLADLPE